MAGGEAILDACFDENDSRVGLDYGTYDIEDEYDSIGDVQSSSTQPNSHTF